MNEARLIQGCYLALPEFQQRLQHISCNYVVEKSRSIVLAREKLHNIL